MRVNNLVPRGFCIVNEITCFKVSNTIGIIYGIHLLISKTTTVINIIGNKLSRIVKEH